jgi:hypothetical protein
MIMKDTFLEYDTVKPPDVSNLVASSNISSIKFESNHNIIPLAEYNPLQASPMNK